MNMRKRQVLNAIATAALIGTIALASNVTLPNVFQANAPARAAEINANFTAVKSAVDNNFAAIQALQTTQGSQATTISNLQSTTSNHTTSISGLQSAVSSLQSADGTYWRRGGNAGTNPANDYLGTSDNSALEFRVNSVRALRMLPGGSIVFGGTACPTSVGTGLRGVFVGGGNEPGVLTNCTFNAAERHRAYDNNVFIGGGYGNQAGSNDATATNAEYAAVVAGAFNSATGPGAFVGAGNENAASGDGAAIVAGSHNTASGNQSFAGGWSANASHTRTFVWSGSSSGLRSSADGQFVVSAPGGFYLASTSTIANVPSGAFLSTDTGAYLSTGGSWTNNSDRNRKAHLQAVDSKAVLANLESLPIYRWNYSVESPAIQHIGPTAQDFAARFRVGTDDTHIATVDADGVALAAVQALTRLSNEQAALIKKQQEQLRVLEARVRSLELR